MMKYVEAIAVCKNLDIKAIKDDSVPESVVLDAIEIILGMETINAVPKEALLNALRWFWAKCVESPMTVVEYNYTKPKDEVHAKDTNAPGTYDLLYEEGGAGTT